MTDRSPGLRPEDGAELHGQVEEIGDGQFRASCYAWLDYRAGVKTETPEYFICGSRADGERWIEQQAVARGFKKWRYESVPPAQPS